MQIIGLSDVTFEELRDHFNDIGVKAAVMEPNMVFGEFHVRSAYEHAKRAFSNNTNRSNDIVVEFLLYMAGERQISKALEKMRPKNDCAVVVIGIDDGVSDVDDIPGKRDDTLIHGTDEKASLMGLDRHGLNIPYEDLALELVAMTDILKI